MKGVFFIILNLKLLQNEVRAFFIVYPFIIQVDKDHPALIRDRKEDFLMPWWDMARKIDFFGYEGGIFDYSESKTVTK